MEEGALHNPGWRILEQTISQDQNQQPFKTRVLAADLLEINLIFQITASFTILPFSPADKIHSRCLVGKNSIKPPVKP